MAFFYFLINYGRQFRAKSKPKDEKYKDLLIDLLKSLYDGKILDFLLEHPLELLIGKPSALTDRNCLKRGLLMELLKLFIDCL